MSSLLRARQVRRDMRAYDRHVRPVAERNHHGEVALMTHGTVVDYYPNVGEACEAGDKIGDDWSLVEVGAPPVRLGYQRLAAE